MRSADFFETHPVFTHAEFLAARAGRGRSDITANNLLAQHLAAGRLVRVRRGLYATVPRGVAPGQVVVDPYLVASRVVLDAVVAYHAALQFFGKTYSVWRRFHYLTLKPARPFTFRDLEFIPVLAPNPVRSRPDLGGGVSEVAHAGGRVRVASLERALVDLLDAPDKGGGWEEIWRSLEMVEFFDLDVVVSYALLLGKALTVARVGFYLEQHRESLMVDDAHLDALAARTPAQPLYFDPARRPGKLLPRWKLIVPEYVMNRRWEEGA